MKTIKFEFSKGDEEWCEINDTKVLVSVGGVDKQPAIKRIKTFEDAMQATGMTLPLDANQLSLLPKSVVAYMKLRIIAYALNDLSNPKIGKKRWFPWFNIYTQKEIDKMDDKKKKKLWIIRGNSSDDANCGLALSTSDYIWSSSLADISACLAVKTRTLAEYFGQQFIDIWADYMIDKS